MRWVAGPTEHHRRGWPHATGLDSRALKYRVRVLTQEDIEANIKKKLPREDPQQGEWERSNMARQCEAIRRDKQTKSDGRLPSISLLHQSFIRTCSCDEQCRPKGTLERHLSCPVVV